MILYFIIWLILAFVIISYFTIQTIINKGDERWIALIKRQFGLTVGAMVISGGVIFFLYMYTSGSNNDYADCRSLTGDELSMCQDHNEEVHQSREDMSRP